VSLLLAIDFVTDLGRRSPNRLEGFFQNLKVGLEHCLVRLADLAPEIKSVAITAAQRLFQASNSSLSFFPMFLFDERKNLPLSVRGPLQNAVPDCRLKHAKLAVRCVPITGGRQCHGESLKLSDFHPR
jgi:hypothetical protein